MHIFCTIQITNNRWHTSKREVIFNVCILMFASGNERKQITCKSCEALCFSQRFTCYPCLCKYKTVLSKYFRVLSDIGLTEFSIMSDRTKCCRTKLFYKADCLTMFGVFSNHLKEISNPCKV